MESLKPGYQNTPEFELILAVDDSTQFHEINIEENVDHYTINVRILHTQMKKRPTEWMHKYGVKMHFNTIKMKECEL